MNDTPTAAERPETALAREVQGACDLVSAALRERRATSPAPHPLLTLLANGLERLLKVVICLQERNRTGTFPDRSIFPAGHRGHGLQRLAHRIVDAADEAAGPDAARTAATLRQVAVRELLEVLSRYAQNGRYHDLDLVLGRPSGAGGPWHHWAGFRRRLATLQNLRVAEVKADAGTDLTNLVIRVVGTLLRLIQMYWPPSTPPPAAAAAADMASSAAFVIQPNEHGHLGGHFPSLGAFQNLAHAVSTRGNPEFAGAADDEVVAAAAAALSREFELNGCAWARQVHGGKVRQVRSAGPAGEADALWTAETGLAVMARSADCPLILMGARPRDQSQGDGPGPVGVAHASWRSTLAGIAGGLVAALTGSGGAAVGGLTAAIAPSAGPCCYEVGPEVRSAMRAAHGEAAERWFLRNAGRLHLDLWRANTDQLRAAGLPLEQIHVAGVCTICRHDLFPSHRAEAGRAGRFAAFIARRGTVVSQA